MATAKRQIQVSDERKAARLTFDVAAFYLTFAGIPTPAGGSPGIEWRGSRRKDWQRRPLSSRANREIGDPTNFYTIFTQTRMYSSTSPKTS